MIGPTRKAKTCANPACGTQFVPSQLGQKVCGWSCGLAIKDVNQDRARKALANVGRTELRAAKERVKSRAEHAMDAQAAFNAYARERDRGNPCISCGINYPQDRNDVWDAGHLRSVGASPATRFNLFNVNKQCVRCNRYLSSNSVMYKIGLVEKIGAERVEKLYAIQKGPGFSAEYLIRVKNIFRKRTRILKKIREAKNNYAA